MSAANLGIRCEWVQSLCVTLLLGEPPGGATVHMQV